MPEHLFRFKQFSISQDRCAMKVNTDGVLLGAWAEVDRAGSILDIGTGTGVIALMMAQRTIAAWTDAIDVDADACIQAGENFSRSAWGDRLSVWHSSLQDYRPRTILAGEDMDILSPNRWSAPVEIDVRYDLIVSNPPYFVNDYKTGDPLKNIAKHGTLLSYQDLIIGMERLLTYEGFACIVLPVFNLSLISSIAAEVSLSIQKMTEVIAVSGKAPYLVLLQLGRKKMSVLRSSITIRDIHGNYTEEYRSLTREFYLKF